MRESDPSANIIHINFNLNAYEHLTEYHALNDPYAAFTRYIQEGGMSGSYLYKTPEAKYDYIADVFNTLIVRDIQR